MNPRKRKEDKAVPLCITMTPDLLQRLDELVQGLKTTRSGLIAAAIMKELKNNE